MALTKRARRRLVLLAGIGVLLVTGAAALWGIQKSLKNSRATVARTQGLADAANGNWGDALANLSLVVANNKTDLDAILAFAETRSQVPAVNGRHLQSALNLYARAATLAKKTDAPKEKLLTALLGKAKMEIALGNIKILQRTAFEILALDPRNDLGFNYLYQIQSIRGDFLPQSWNLFTRGQWKSDQAWLDALRKADPEVPSALRWALERMLVEEGAIERREDVLQLIRSGGSLDAQRLQMVPEEERESTVDITQIWADEATENEAMFHLLLAREALRSEDAVKARQAIAIVQELLVDESEMLVQTAEILSVLGTPEDMAESEKLLKRARELAVNDANAAASLTIRAWHKGRRDDLQEMLDLKVSGELNDLFNFQMITAMITSLDRSDQAAERIEELKRLAESADESTMWRASVNLIIELLEINNEEPVESGTETENTLNRVMAIGARFPEEPLVQTITGDIFAKFDQAGSANEAWTRGLELLRYDSAPIARRLINGLLNDGSNHRAFRESVEVAARMRTIEGAILLCRSWLALDSAGIPAQSVVPGFDLASSPLEFIETVIDAIEVSGGDVETYQPLLAQAAVRSGRLEMANEIIDRALSEEWRISVLFPLSQTSLRGKLGREFEIMEAIITADVDEEFADQIVILKASILRGEGKAAEAFTLSESQFKDRLDARSQRLRQAEILDNYTAGGVTGEEAAAIILAVEPGELDQIVLLRLLRGLVVEGNRELSETVLQRMVAKAGANAAGSTNLALGLARFTLAFDRDFSESVNAAILRLDPIVSAGASTVEHELTMVELLGLQKPPKLTRAIEVLRESVRRRPGRFDTTLRLISFLQKAGRFQEAEELLGEIWRRRDAAPPEVRRLIPRLMSGQGNVDEIMAAQCELAKETNDPTDLLACIRARYQAGATEEADAALDAMLLLETRPVAVDLESASRSARRGDIDRAIDILETAPGFESDTKRFQAIGSLLLRTNRLAELDSRLEGLPDAAMNSADLQILIGLRALRSDPPAFKKADEALDRAFEVGSERSEILQRILTIRVENPELREGASAVVNRLKSTEPEQAMLLNLALMVPMVEGEFRPSLSQIAEAKMMIESQRDSRAAWLLGVNLHLAVLEKALAGQWPSDADFPEGQRSVGRFAESQRLPIAIVDLLVSATSRFPGDMLFPVQLSEVYLRLGRKEEALASAREGLRRAGSGRTLGNVLPVAVIESRLNRPDLAIRTLEPFRGEVENDPSSRPKAWRVLVENLLLDGRVDEGWALFRSFSPNLDPRLLSMIWLETASKASPEIAAEAIELARNSVPPGLARLRAAGAGLAAFRRTGAQTLRDLTENILAEIAAYDSSKVGALQVELLSIGLIEADSKLEAIRRYEALLLSIPPVIMQDMFVFPTLSDERRSAAAPYINSTVMGMNNMAALIASLALDGMLPLDEAAKWLKRATEISGQMAIIISDSMEVIDTRAMVAMANGDFSEAVDLARLAVSESPERASFRWTLSQALQANGDTDAAYAEAEEANRILRRDIEPDEELSVKLANYLNGS